MRSERLRANSIVLTVYRTIRDHNDEAVIYGGTMRFCKGERFGIRFCISSREATISVESSIEEFQCDAVEYFFLVVTDDGK